MTPEEIAQNVSDGAWPCGLAADEIKKLIAAEREACVQIVLTGYHNDWTHAMIIDEIRARGATTE